jgi:hypothetical protein
VLARLASITSRFAQATKQQTKMLVLCVCFCACAFVHAFVHAFVLVLSIEDQNRTTNATQSVRSWMLFEFEASLLFFNQTFIP